MVKNGTEFTRRTALGHLLEVCQETIKAEKVWR
jgi:hypothetical protein